MKKAAKIITLFCLIIVMLAGTFNALTISTTKSPPLSIQILDKKATSTYPPIIKNGIVFVPLRYVGEGLGFTVSWNASTQTMQLVKNSQTLKITIGKTDAYSNGKKVKLDAAPVMNNARAYVPLSFLQKYFNYQSTYDSTKKLVLIKNKVAPVLTKAISVLGEKLASTEKPLIQNGTVYIPLRIVAGKLQYKFIWNATTKVVELSKSGQAFKLTINKTDAYLNGSKIKLDKAPLLVNGRSYVSLAFMQKYFNYDFVYDKTNVVLSINVKKPNTTTGSRGEETRAPTANVEDVVYDDNGGFPQLNIVADQPLTYTSFAMSNPDRRVIDITNAKLSTDFESKEIGNGGIIRVRVGQFSTEPMIVRVVVDLENEKVCKVVQSDDKKSISLIYANIIHPVQLTKEGSNDVITVSGSSLLDTSVYELDNPSRLVLDIKRAVLDQIGQAITADTPCINSVRTGQVDVGIARVVVDMKPGMYYDVKTQGNTSKISISKDPFSFVNYQANYNSSIVELSPDVNVEYMASVSDDKKTLTIMIPQNLDVEQKRYDISDNILEYIEIKKEIHNDSTYTVASIRMKDMVNYEFLSPSGSKLLKFKFTYKPQTVEQLKIVIDAGHGGKDPGATSQDGTKEKDLNLDVAQRLNNILKGLGFKTIVTRTDDSYVDLASRANAANQNYADFFMCIHFNAFTSKTQGIETLYYPNTVTAENPLSNWTIAAIFHEELLNTLKRPARGITPRPNLYVLNKTKMPAILTELGFITNPEELSKIKTDDYREMAARALAVSIIKYFRDIQKMDININTDDIYSAPIPQSTDPAITPAAVQDTTPVLDQPQDPSSSNGDTQITQPTNP